MGLGIVACVSFLIVVHSGFVIGVRDSRAGEVTQEMPLKASTTSVVSPYENPPTAQILVACVCVRARACVRACVSVCVRVCLCVRAFSLRW